MTTYATKLEYTERSRSRRRKPGGTEDQRGRRGEEPARVPLIRGIDDNVHAELDPG